MVLYYEIVAGTILHHMIDLALPSIAQRIMNHGLEPVALFGFRQFSRKGVGAGRQRYLSAKVTQDR